MLGLAENRLVGDLCRMSPSPPADSLPLFRLPPKPDFSIEHRQAKDGYITIAGIDEAGRGPLAGPVVAAAVVLDPANIPDGLNDSKKISALLRITLFTEIIKFSQVAWASAPARLIDKINIRQATLASMSAAANALPVTPDKVLVDGRDIPQPLINIGSAYIKGDARSLSIAAASIVAKVVRDRIMIRADLEYPGYVFANHKGYGTREHRDAIDKFGPCTLHRLSFAPLKYQFSTSAN